MGPLPPRLQPPCQACLPAEPLQWWPWPFSGLLSFPTGSYNGIHTQASAPGSLNSLESLEGLPAQAGAVGGSQAGDLLGRGPGVGCSPETYLSPPQQEWLALRLHGGSRWRVPSLACMCRAVEP